MLSTDREGPVFFRKSCIVNMALVLGGTLLAFLLAEGLLRLLNLPQFATDHHPCIYIKDNEIGYTFTPNASDWRSRTGEMHNLVRTNSLGFHDIEPDPGRGDEGLRVAVLGDSTTAALEVDVLDGWTQILQKELRGKGFPSAHVYNMGLSGSGTEVQLKLLKRHLSLLHPDIVILAFFWNDIKDLRRTPFFKECYKGYIICYMNEEQRTMMISSLDSRMPGSRTLWLFDHSFLFRAISCFNNRNVILHMNHLRSPDLGVSGDTGRKGNRRKIRVRQKLRRVLNQFVNLSRKHNFRFIIMPVPSKDDINQSIDTLRDNLSSQMQDKLKIIDISSAIQELIRGDRKTYKDLFWPTDAHYNVYGSSILGRSAARTLIDQSVLPP